MTNLIKAKGPDIVKCTGAADKAFAEDSPLHNLVLVAPDFEKEFILQMDASKIGLGAVLSQMVGEEEHPVLHLNRKLLPREQKYTVVH